MNTHMYGTRHRRISAQLGSGFTIIEAAITLAIFFVVVLAFSRSAQAVLQSTEMAEAEFSASLGGLKGLDGARTELQRAGWGGGFPELHDGNSVGDTYADFAHGPAQILAGDPAAREIVYRTPDDADADGWPDVDANGNVVWSPVLRAMVLVPEGGAIGVGAGADGGNGDSNELWMIDNAGGRRRLARNVSGLIFDDSASSGFQVPANTIRVRLRTRGASAGAGESASNYEAHIRMANSIQN